MRNLLAAVTTLAFTALCSGAQIPRALFTAAPGSPFAVGNQPGDVALGDVNSDGHPDIFSANIRSQDVTILLSDGRGGFAPAPSSPVPAGFGAHLVALADFNEDGRLDLALTCHDSNDVVLLLGDGRGGFRPAPGSPFPLLTGVEPHNHGLAVADINGDRHLDLATSNCNAGSTSVLLGDGRGSLVPVPDSPFAVGRCPYPLALGDINDDGHVDIATPNVGSNNATGMLGDGQGGFSPAPGSPLAVLARPYFAALSDLNGDRKLDLILSHDDSTRLTILLGAGTGRFAPAPASPLDIGYRGGQVLLADYNRDGHPDLTTGTSGNNVVVFLGDGRGGFRAAPGSPYAVGRGPWRLATADLNRDGKLDLVTANFDSHNVTVLLGR